MLVKWWLLAIPHYAVVAIFAGGFGFGAWDHERWAWSSSKGGLIGLVVLFAGVVLLVRTNAMVCPPRDASALFVVGGIAALLAFGMLAGGCELVAVDQTHRDESGFLMSPTEEFTTPTYAIVSESAQHVEGAERVVDTFLGTVRIRSKSERSVFVGIGSEKEADAYLKGVEHDVVTDFEG